MDIDGLLSTLDYKDSPAFLSDTQLDDYPAYSFIFSRAKRDCNLRGVYSLREKLGGESSSQSLIPLVYVCEADSEEEARNIHRLIWNQNIVPFLFVLTPRSIRLYPGFKFDAKAYLREDDQAICPAKNNVDDVLRRFGAFRAQSIDNGEIWPEWGDQVDPQRRVDWTLLKNLNELSAWLLKNGLSRTIAHSLIGKYVYLRYLRDRGILSDEKLRKWKIAPDSVFGGNATEEGLGQVSKELEKWLNGSIFPFPLVGKDAPSVEQIQKVASVFQGDEPTSGQMHLDFTAYDFAHIPIETLSVVYQQFLHAEGKGRKSGAYYTPLHLVNFILDELDTKKPLEKGMKVFDAACGSGAFLVQCYRRLIERKIRSEPKAKPQPKDLRQLLTDHIYGMDIDADACGITELSLTITLLDYVEPPDLEKWGYHNFQLPALRNKNIFHCEEGFFAPSSGWEKGKPKSGFDWIVGNPPWKTLSAKKLEQRKLEKSDEAAIEWVLENKKRFPTTNNQIAEAFAWEVSNYLSSRGIVGLLMPATTLFKKTASFRHSFFSRMGVWCIVNFANLRHLLFWQAVGPASAFFYCPNRFDKSTTHDQSILTYSPLAIHQLSRYEPRGRKRKKNWTIIVNASEIREIPRELATSGSFLPWKTAMWGSPRDRRLLDSVSSRFPSLGDFAGKHTLAISQGLELRPQDAPEPIVPVDEVSEKNKLVMEELGDCELIFAFPDRALKQVGEEEAFVRKGRSRVPLKVCRPPHIVVDAKRRFSVFSKDFLVVPSRQIGIAGDQSKAKLLKALSLYLSSEFAKYHQFLSSTLWGIERDRPTKFDLENLPVPLDKLTAKDLDDWSTLHAQLVLAKPIEKWRAEQLSLFDENKKSNISKQLLKQLNDLVYDLLDIRKTERWLVNDLLHVRMKLNEGKIADEAVALAGEGDISEYAKVLKSSLDQFIVGNDKREHCIEISIADAEAVVKVALKSKRNNRSVKIVQVNDSGEKKQFQKLRRRLLTLREQWIYFNRNLRIYDREGIYFFKPRQRIFWLNSQALADADEYIADMLATSAENT